MAGWAFHGTRGGSLSELYGKEERWFLSSLTRNQAVQPDHADYGSTPMRIPTTLQSSSSLQSSLARIESLPALRIREQERDPISGLMPSESRAVHDWTSSMRASHGRLPMTRREPSVGDVTKFGVKDECTGKTIYLPMGVRYGVPEALGVERAEAVFSANARLAGDYRRRPITADPGLGQLQLHASQRSLARTPSAAELEDLLRKRSRAAGLGGKHAKVCDVVQKKWSVLYSSGSACSVMGPHRLGAPA